MRRLTTDQGTPFRSRLSQAFFTEFNIEHRMTTNYHQQADRLAERANKTIMGMVRQHMEPLERQKDWANLLQQHTMAYNTSVQASIGYKPFFLMHCFHAATAVEVVLPTPMAIRGEEPVEDSRDKALRKLAESQARQKKAYDLRQKDVTCKIGDFVMVEDLTPIPGLTSKLRAPYKGPGKVVGISADRLNCTCEFVDVNGRKKQVMHHVSHFN